MEGYLNIDITAIYGDQLISIIEKMTNGEVGVTIEDVNLTKDEFVEVCKEVKES